MTHTPVRDRLVDLRRELHRYPEPAWREFYTTCRLAEEVEGIGVDRLHLGRAAMDPTERLAVPSSADIAAWRDRAREDGAREDLLDALDDCTGALAVLDRGEGPTVALRVDIDGLLRDESTDETHRPAAEGFRSRRDGAMHACGHDAHATIGLGVLEAVAESDFSGTFKVFFQPAEEKAGGGRPMAKSEHVADVDYLFAVHVGLDHPTGEVVAGIVEPLAVSNLGVTFRGESSHAGLAPNEGRNAMQALGTAIQNVYAIPRHADGATRVNVGRVEGGTASNVTAERIEAEAEVRGETTALMEYMKTEFERAVRAAADAHRCDAEVTVEGQAPRADSDPALAALVGEAARSHSAVDRVVDDAPFGASEDGTYLMRAVQERGGLATYAIVGTDHPTGHHTATFDIDESTLPTAVEVLTDAILTAAARDPLGRAGGGSASTGGADST
ncbi:amidohydrolase [Haladaptatus salinisoli]|uniref:amidohydrolase n=1 Tax=Haladaptatus salinisoli TaxID=2884876 RepID=UPI001D09FB50|nr:amidohydrolase [Haladaptatus salinisoli]